MRGVLLRGRTARQAIQGRSDRGEIVEGEETIGAGPELAWGLRSAEQKQAKQGGLIPTEIENGAGLLLIFAYAGARP